MVATSMTTTHLTAPDLATGSTTLIEECIRQCKKGGLYLEFGVYHGRSLAQIRNIMPDHATLYGFDSFEGLPYAWDGNLKSTFKTNVRPSFPNTKLVVGMFADTIKPFLQTHEGFVSFVNVDCDIYESARDVLFGINERIIAGTVIRFDELFGYYGWEQHEWRALREWAANYDRKYDFIGREGSHAASILIEV
jgi:hypothetical protein